jgi:hypothetical protein
LIKSAANDSMKSLSDVRPMWQFYLILIYIFYRNTWFEPFDITYEIQHLVSDIETSENNEATIKYGQSREIGYIYAIQYVL